MRRTAWIDPCIDAPRAGGRANHSQGDLIKANTSLSEREDRRRRAASPPSSAIRRGCAEERRQSPTLGNVWVPRQMYRLSSVGLHTSKCHH